MRIGIHDADGGSYPNLALLKLAAHHKQRGDIVERYLPLASYDLVLSSKVFSWTAESLYLPSSAVKGGTGYGLMRDLPDAIEHICPDYAFAGVDYSMGFLTRGCIRSCPWCIVPKKEGELRSHADIAEFARHKRVRLMDNNVLALPEYAAKQFEKISALGLAVDINQGVDARLIDRPMARRLSKMRWWKPLRLACDHKSQMRSVAKAVRLLRAAGVTPRQYSCYVLVKDVEDAYERVKFLLGLGVDPFAQAYRDQSGTEPTQEQKDFERYVNCKPILKTTSWENYRPRKTQAA